MSDVMVVIDKKNWLAEQKWKNTELVPGDVLHDWADYHTSNPLVAGLDPLS